MDIFKDAFYAFPYQLAYIITKSFFRSVKVIGASNIPQDEPTIICANHSNQFMDAINIYGNVASSQRPVKFLMAAKSYRRPVIGHFGRWLKCIPVERAQDLASSGKGKIISIAKDRVRGQGTEFKKQVSVGCAFLIKGIEELMNVKEIISDEECIIGECQLDLKNVNYSFKVQPKIDQSMLYSEVSNCLNNNELIGIFPEGGSSDRTDILPLKAGVCIMALEAMVKYNKPVNIICCGFNYFKAHKFRSRVIMEFGVPYKIPLSYIDDYKKSRRDTIAKLLTRITFDLRQVIYTAENYQELTCILMASRLYKPDIYIQPQEEIEINKRFFKGYNSLKENETVVQLMKDVQNYRQGLKSIGITDSELKKIQKHFIIDLYYFLKSLLIFLICLSFAFPGLLLNYPIGLVLVYLSERERKICLKNSQVKIKGNDVVASHQVKLGLFALPLYHCFFSFMLYTAILEFTKFTPFECSLIGTAFFVIYPFYSYLMLMATDRFVSKYKHLMARYHLLFNFDSIRQLLQLRKKLKEQIDQLVDQHFDQVIGNGFDRIISKNDTLQQPKHLFTPIEYAELNNPQFIEETFAHLGELGI